MKVIFLTTVILFLNFALFSQSFLTRGDVYDFNINDEFQYSNYGNPEQAPNSKRIKIIDKFYTNSNETVNYVRQFDNYSSQLVSQPEFHLVYTFYAYIDTIQYSNLDEILYQNTTDWTIENDSVNDYFQDSLYNSSDFCNRLVYESKFCDHCIFEGDFSQHIYGKGLGEIYYYHQFIDLQATQHETILTYFKKGTEECGSRNLLNDIFELKNNTFSIAPNPSSKSIRISATNINEIKSAKILNSIGQVISLIKLSELNSEIDVINLEAGFYFVEIEINSNHILLNQFIKI